MYSCRATEWPFWFGLILPFSIIYVFNWIIFIVIMFQLLRRRSDNKTDRKNMGRVFKRNALIAVGLSLLFGLGWGFGLTATSSDVKEVTFAFQLLFSVFVGSQGVLIFIFHGIRSPHFRQVWAIALGLRHKRKGFSLRLHKNATKEESGQYSQSTMTVFARQPSKYQQKEPSSYLSEPVESVVEMSDSKCSKCSTNTGTVYAEDEQL